jgi:5-formyltetrahydrofolate cyclo-ligase
MGDVSNDERAWKQELRAQGLARRRSQPDKEDLSRRILAQLLALPEYGAARTVMSYVSLPDEVYTNTLIEHAWADGRRVVVPYCVGSLLQLFVLERLEELSPGAMGILEPRPELRSRVDRRADPAELDLVVVPGVVFDRRGGRIGFGKGYYDRLLGRLRPTAAIVALAFECQMVDRLPMFEHDVLMHRIVTEQGAYVGQQAAGPA